MMLELPNTSLVSLCLSWSFYIYFMFLKHLNLYLLLRLLYLKHLLRYQYCKLASLYFKQITTISEYYLGNSTKYF